MRARSLDFLPRAEHFITRLQVVMLMRAQYHRLTNRGLHHPRLKFRVLHYSASIRMLSVKLFC